MAGKPVAAIVDIELFNKMRALGSAATSARLEGDRKR